ncbi:hypothetical protein J6590_011821 [Homalodisca vitripennis]|nr:hypothetical protein J6590_011821 [Homalodisca vitripennis]
MIANRDCCCVGDIITIYSVEGGLITKLPVYLLATKKETQKLDSNLVLLFLCPESRSNNGGRRIEARDDTVTGDGMARVPPSTSPPAAHSDESYCGCHGRLRYLARMFVHLCCCSGSRIWSQCSSTCFYGVVS